MTEFALEYLPGLKPFVAAELAQLGARVIALHEDEGRIAYRGARGRLLALRRVGAVYERLHFAIPRPKALLGDANFRRLAGRLRAVAAAQPEMTSFRLDAAGKDSPVFQRLAQALAAATGLAPSDEGALLMRVRPAEGGWEVLLRLTPRPLSARRWRVCNLPGGLNATVAVALNDLSAPQAGDRYLNAMCGSGTLLIERAAEAAAALIGVDISRAALRCAEANLKAAGLAQVQLLEADARALPFAAGSFDAITADLPWGDAVGSHAANAELYPALLAELARVAAPGARCVIFTHELKLFERCLAAQRRWQLRRSVRFFHGGHYPRAYRLDLR